MFPFSPAKDKGTFFLKNLFFDILIIGLFFIYLFMVQTHEEVISGAIFRIGNVLAQTQALGDLGVKYLSNKVINIGFVTLPLDFPGAKARPSFLSKCSK